jgi:hypothetical protein
MPFDAEVALQGAQGMRYAWYDTDNDGRFDLMLQGSAYGDRVSKAYKLAADGTVTELKDGAGGYLLDAKHLNDASLAPRFGKLASSVADSATNPETSQKGAEITVPDPIWGGGKSGKYNDGDGDGKADSASIHSRWSSGWLFDADQDGLGTIQSDADLQRLINNRAVDAEMTVVHARGEFWAFYDTDVDGEHDLALATPAGAHGTTRAYERKKGASWQQTTNHLGRRLFRAGLVSGNSERLQRLLTPLFNGLATDEGLGSVPNPKNAHFSLSGSSELKKRVAYGYGYYIQAQLVDVDGDSSMGSGNINELVRNGQFKADFARYVNGGWVWAYYDTDGDGGWDVVLFGENAGGKPPLAAYRLKNGALVADPALSKGSLIQPSLFSDANKQKGATELFGKLYGN